MSGAEVLGGNGTGHRSVALYIFIYHQTGFLVYVCMCGVCVKCVGGRGGVIPDLIVWAFSPELVNLCSREELCNCLNPDSM